MPGNASIGKIYGLPTQQSPAINNSFSKSNIDNSFANSNIVG